MRVKRVTLGYLQRKPPVLFIEATGLVSTTGWNAPLLQARIHAPPPADGYQDLDFVAVAPQGLHVPVISRIHAAPLFLSPIPPWLRGVRVHATDNAVARPTADGVEALLEIDLANIDDPAPVGTKATAFDHPDIVYDFIDDVVALESVPADRHHHFNLLSVSNWQDIRTEQEPRQCEVFGRSTCLQIPVGYQRRSRHVVEVQTCWNGEADLAPAIEDLARECLAAGLFGDLLSGSLSTTCALLETSLRNGLADRAGGEAATIKVGLRRRRICGPWERIG